MPTKREIHAFENVGASSGICTVCGRNAPDHLITHVRFLLAGLELTNEAGEALIQEVRIRMRRPN